MKATAPIPFSEFTDKSVLLSWTISLSKDILWSWLCFHYINQNEFASGYTAAEISEIQKILYENEHLGVDEEGLRLLYLFTNGEEVLGTDDWLWTSFDRLEMRTYVDPPASTWAIIGNIIRFLQNNNLLDAPVDRFKNVPTYSYILNTINPYLSIILQTPNRWIDIICPDEGEEGLQNRVNRLREKMQALSERYEVALNNTIITTPLSESKIARFIEEIEEGSVDNSIFESIFSHFGNYVNADNTEIAPIIFPFSIGGVGKRMFIDTYSVALYTSQAAYHFSKQIDKTLLDQLTVSDIGDLSIQIAIQTSIRSLTQREHEASLIIFGITDFSKIVEKLRDIGYEAELEDKVIGVHKIYGWINSAAVIAVGGDEFKGKCLVADFAQSFLMTRQIRSNGRAIEVNITEISRDEAYQNVQERNVGHEPTESELLEEQLRVLIDLKKYLIYTVINSDAFILLGFE